MSIRVHQWLKNLFRRSPRHVLHFINLPELGPRPDWKDIEPILRGADALADPRLRFLLHLLLYHLGDARAEHEESPAAPPDFVAFHRGAAARINLILAQLLHLLRGTSDKGVPNAVKTHFGWEMPKQQTKT